MCNSWYYYRFSVDHAQEWKTAQCVFIVRQKYEISKLYIHQLSRYWYKCFLSLNLKAFVSFSWWLKKMWKEGQNINFFQMSAILKFDSPQKENSYIFHKKIVQIKKKMHVTFTFFLKQWKTRISRGLIWVHLT